MKNKILFWPLKGALLLQLVLCVNATPITFSAGASPALEIPDDNLNGVASTININSAPGKIVGLTLTLDVAGGFNGDYFAYLQFGTGLVLLLDRLGVSADNPYGSAGAGFNITFNDSSPNITSSISSAGAPLTGTWASQNDTFDVFNGKDADGAWNLFFADRSPGGVGVLKDWSLNFQLDQSNAIPEKTGSAPLLAFGLVTLFLIFLACCAIELRANSF